MNEPNEPERAESVHPAPRSLSSSVFDLRGTFVFSEGQERSSSQSEQTRHAVLLHPDYLMVHTNMAVTLHHLPTCTRLWTIPCSSFNFAFHQQRQFLALAPGDPALALLIWDLRTGQILHRLTYKRKGNLSLVDLGGLAFSPDGSMVAAGMEGEIMLWETTTGRVLQTLQTESYDIYTITFHPSKDLLAAGSFNHTDIWIWQLSSGQFLHRWEEPENFMDQEERAIDRPYHVTFTLDGKWLLACCGEGGLRVWDVERACEVAGPDAVFCASFLSLAPDGQSVAVSDGGQAVRILEIGTWRFLHEFAGTYPPGSFSPDGQRLATIDAVGNVLVWEVATGKLLFQVAGSGSNQVF